MFAQRFMANFRKEKKNRVVRQKVDVVAEQVRNMLQKADQKLILMVRG